MRYNILSIVLLLVGCQPSRDHLPDKVPEEDSYIICESKFYMSTNATENGIEGEWIQVRGANELGVGYAPYYEFSFNNIKGKWSKLIFSRSNPQNILEASYKIEENYWVSDNTALFKIEQKGFNNTTLDKYFYLEFDQVNENEFKLYHRGFKVDELPSDFDWENPDPKLSVRTPDNSHAVYQRVK